MPDYEVSIAKASAFKEWVESPPRYGDLVHGDTIFTQGAHKAHIWKTYEGPSVIYSMTRFNIESENPDFDGDDTYNTLVLGVVHEYVTPLIEQGIISEDDQVV